MRELTRKQFEEEIKLGTALVQFATTTCGPCKMMTGILEDISPKVEHAFSIAKVYVDDEPGLLEKYEFMSVPTTILFKNGEAVHTMHGFRTKGVLMEELRHYL